MKFKIFLLTVLLCSICGPMAYAQAVDAGEKSQKKWSLETLVKYGMSSGGDYLAPVSEHNHVASSYQPIDKAFTPRLSAGITAGYYFSDRTGINAGIAYVKLGQDYDEYSWQSTEVHHSTKTVTNTLRRTVSLEYLRIPLTFIYNFNPEKKMSFVVTGGVYLGILLKYKDIGTSASRNQTTQGYVSTTEITNNFGTTTYTDALYFKLYNTLDFGGLIAAGPQIKLSNALFVSVKVSYDYGFSNANEEFYISPDEIPYHNSFLGLSAGLRKML